MEHFIGRVYSPHLYTHFGAVEGGRDGEKEDEGGDEGAAVIAGPGYAHRPSTVIAIMLDTQRAGQEHAVDHYKCILLTLFLCSGVLLIVLSIPLIRRRVPPNTNYGLRIKRTLDNSDIWYAANRYAAWRMLSVGILLMVVATGSYFWPGIGFVAYALICLIVLLSGLSVVLFQSLRYVHRLPHG